MIRLHGTVVSLAGRGVLLKGPSGSGKSDLALRLVGRGAGLVADDQVEVFLEGGALFARAPEALAGLIEVRGIGIRRMAHVPRASLVAVVDLDPAAPRARLPEAEVAEIAGAALPVYRLGAFEASAPEKVLLLLEKESSAYR